MTALREKTADGLGAQILEEFGGQEDPLEKGMATHSSIFAWRIPWSEEPGRLKL